MLDSQPFADQAGAALPAPAPPGEHRETVADAGAPTVQHTTVDYDIHGVVGVRLVDPAPADTRFVEGFVGRLRQPLGRQPDIVVRFVDRISVRGIRWLHVGQSGFGRRGLYVRCEGARQGWTCMRLDRAGARCEILSEIGLGFVPHLDPLIRLAALRRGFIPLHASAFVFAGVGVIAAGWPHSGKSSSLLAFAERGASYVGDDLVLLSGDGRRVLGLPRPLELSGRQVDGLAVARERRGRARLVLDRAARQLERLSTRGLLLHPGDSPLRQVLGRASSALQRRLGAQLPLEALFGDRVALEARPRTVFLMMSHAADGACVEPGELSVSVERLAASVQRDIRGLEYLYLASRFAFPWLRNELIENAGPIAAGLLRTALADKEIRVVRHSYPPALTDLYDAMRPYCGAPDGPEMSR